MSDCERWGPLLHWLDRASSAHPDTVTPSADAASHDDGTQLDLPESFTRFVLPFAYAPQRLGEDQLQHIATSTQSARIWQLDTPEVGSDRQQYFTAETSDVLYRRSRRGRLRQLTPAAKVGDSVATQTLALANGEFEVALAPPELILFEWPAAALMRERSAGAASANFADDPLLIGFLYYQAHFPRERQDGSPQQLHLKHLLWFNELFRYVREPFSGHREERLGKLFSAADLAQYDDAYFDRWFEQLKWPLRYNDSTYALFPEAWNEHSRAWIKGCSSQHAHAMCHPDSRAFVATFAQLCDGARSLLPAQDSGGAASTSGGGTDSHPPPRNSYGGEDEQRALMRTHGWVSLLNVDNPPRLNEASAFEKTWVCERTYTRWAHWGTLYGYTPHSAAVVTDACLDPPLWQHFGGTYFDQTVLLLYLRTVIFRISQRINVISAQQRDAIDESGRAKAADAFRSLSRQITQFINLYQYPFLSLQQQGVEMYELQRRNMDIDALYREVREEVERTQAQLDMNRQMDLAQASHRLGVVATYGIPVGIAALFGVLWNDLGLKVLAKSLANAVTCNASWWTETAEAMFGVLLAAGIFCAALTWTRKLIGSL